jgi:hypothetical protein
MSAMLGLFLAIQTQAPVTQAPAGPTVTPSVAAAQAPQPPELDGRDDEPIWRQAEAITGFRQARPNEGADPAQRTEARVAYDAQNLYVFVRAYDTAPDSVVSLLSRRDEMPASDYVIVMIDSYRDRRTGYQFGVNPAGVKMDQSMVSDGDEDSAWDAVWDVATRIDSLGWTAEYRIPLSQLRFARADQVTFGFGIWRNIQRHTMQVSWPLIRQSVPGFVSQFGDLTGMVNLSSPGRAEVVPYVVTKDEPRLGAATPDRSQGLTLGGDLKYAVASNLTLNATINPDFGQVEADPGQLNLSAFEVFFSERRPFFVEGGGLFQMPINCFIVNDCQTGEGLFYSRRIGRSPRLAGRYGDASSPTATRILAAAKLTGRLPGGLSVGLIDAMTDRVGGVNDATIEPRTNYAVFRLNQDYAAGTGSVGLLVTSVERSLDSWSEDFMHKSALTGALDARKRWGKYEVSGSYSLSRVSGTAEAIAATQRDPVHYYQRPDDELEYDPTRTSLTGSGLEVRFNKVGGERSRFETGYGRRTAGLDVNDIGFLRQGDQQNWSTWYTLRWNRPNGVFQRLNWNFNHWRHWTLEGLPTDVAFNTNVHVQWNNRWWLHAGGTIGNIGETYCSHNCSRGGPAVRQELGLFPWIGIEGDSRRALSPNVFFNYSRTDGGRSESFNVNPNIRLRVADRFTTSLGANITRNRDDNQWFGNFTDDEDATHYTFAHLEQKTLGLTWRAAYTFTPNATLQVYANPFISKGTYTNVRELDAPRSENYDDRYTAYDAPVAENPGGFNVKQFRSNVVFRWEYRPGSTLFLVWSQGRQDRLNHEGGNSFGGDFNDRFGRRADDVFLVKMSYWLNW